MVARHFQTLAGVAGQVLVNNVLYSSNFDSETSGSIATGWAAIANTWQVGTTNPVSGAKSFGCTTASDGAICSYTAGSTSQADQVFVISQKAAANTGFNGPWVRSSATANKGYFALLGSARTSLTLFKCTGAGSYSSLGSAAPGFTVTNGNTYKFETRAIGTLIEVRFWDASGARPGTAQISVTDSSATTGIPGIYFGADGGAGVGAFDDALWTSS